MRSKASVRENVLTAIDKNFSPDEIKQYISDEGYSYDDIATTSDKISGYLFKAAQGLTMGNADEIIGAGQTFFNDKPYQANRDSIRTAEKLFDQSNPISSLTSELGGGLLTGFGAVKNADTVMDLTKQGAKLGAVGGYGYSEADDLAGQAFDTATGSLWGGTLGMVTKPFVNTLKWATRPFIEPIANKVTSQSPSKAVRDITRDINRDGMTVDQIKTRLTQLGDDAIIPDAAGGNVMQLADHVANQPGPGVEIAKRFLENRGLSAGQRLSDDVGSITGKQKNFYTEMDDLLAKRQKEATPLYNKYVNDLNNRVDMGKLAEFLRDRPFLMDQFEAVAKDKTWGVSGYPANSIKFMDAVKKSLDDMQQSMGDKLSTNKQKNKASMVQNHLRELRDFADDSVPGYKEARKAYEIPSKQMEMMEQGRKFMRGDVELLEKDIKAMTDDQREYFLAGVVRQIDDTLANTPDSHDMTRRLFNTKKKRDAIKAAFNDEEMFKQFEKSISREGQYHKTKQVLGNSKTQMRQAKAEEAGSNLLDIGMEAAQQNPLGMVRSGVNALRNSNAGYSEQELSDLARYLYTPRAQMSPLLNDLQRRQGLIDVSKFADQLMKGGLLGGGVTETSPMMSGLLR